MGGYRPCGKFPKTTRDVGGPLETIIPPLSPFMIRKPGREVSGDMAVSEDEIPSF